MTVQVQLNTEVYFSFVTFYIKTIIKLILAWVVRSSESGFAWVEWLV